jgi:hypothetical protein
MEPLGYFGRILVVLGLVLVALGLVLSVGPKIPFLGRLPGDIRIVKGPFTFYFPIVSCIILSILLTIILNMFRK